MKERIKIPPVGHRTLKTAFSVLLCYLIYLLRGREGLVFYSMLAAMWCIRPYFENTLEMAKQRVTGTVIGSAYGLVALLVKLYLFPQDSEVFEVLFYVLAAAAIIPIIETTLILKKRDASYFSCVVFLCIVVNHSGDANPFIFVANRALDTLIGVAVGIGVNSFRLPTRKRKDILFVSGIDHTLIEKDESLSDYSRRQLNYLISAGANFTVSTRRAPAAVQNILSGVHLKLPIIAMDGAVLYDCENRTYLHAYVISCETAEEIRELAQEQDLNCFSNVILDECLLIYYRELNNDAQKDLYNRLRKSPMRNYVQGEPREGRPVVYFMLLDRTEKMQSFFDTLRERGYTERLRVEFYPAEAYEGYSYIKIYNKNASRENMLVYLQEMTGLKKTVTFGSLAGQYDVTVDGDTSQVARTLQKMYEEPVLFGKHRKKENKE